MILVWKLSCADRSKNCSNQSMDYGSPIDSIAYLQLYICTQVLKLVGIYSKLIVLCNTYKYNFMKILCEAQHLSTYFCIGSCEKGYNNINMQNCLYMQVLFPEYIALLILYNLYISIGHTCLLVSEIFAYRNNTSLNSHSLSINNQTIIIKKIVIHALTIHCFVNGILKIFFYNTSWESLACFISPFPSESGLTVFRPLG